MNAMLGSVILFVGCATEAAPAKNAPPQNGPYAWVYGEWELCSAGTGMLTVYARRGTSRDGCDAAAQDGSWVFAEDGTWASPTGKGTMSWAKAQSRCELPEKSVGIAGDMPYMIAIWESDSRIAITSPCLD
jgi:hypothetical protein